MNDAVAETGELVREPTEEAVLTQIDCGAKPTRGTLVSIPSHLYPAVAERLATMGQPSGDWSRRWAWHQFFVQRCSTAFLRVYTELDRDFIPRLLRFGSYLSVVPEPRVLARLHEGGLLADADRRNAVARASDLAVETPDADWLDAPEWKVLATESERGSILERVRDQLIPVLSDELSNWRSNYSGDREPDDYYRPLEEALARYASALAGDPRTLIELEAAIEEVQSLRLDGNGSYEPARAPRWATPSPVSDAGRSDRSIFDDVDA